MILKKEQWEKEDIKTFQKYLESLKNEERVNWTKNILKTDLPCLAIKSSIIKSIAKEISTGNYLSFLDLMIWDYYDNTAINGYLISMIKDFNLMKKYLDIYSSKADNWATCDVLSFNIKGNEDNFILLAETYIKSNKPFIRRIGIESLFKIINNDNYIDKVFKILNQFTNEENYYVNMINAWLLCDMFIKQRDKTITYLKNNKLNKFTINKMISKCRDSYRVSKEDKEMLLNYKRKD